MAMGSSELAGVTDLLEGSWNGWGRVHSRIPAEEIPKMLLSAVPLPSPAFGSRKIAPGHTL
ncbi:hypothetical protein BN77_p2170004 [Rhizobium mesoamericanum STM3625]|uniref:Uncharacterized protein n=1 Tax=Rhizobium mesoamericanum STM3625 TaxID=1211777 RepID=K0Q5I6_9HYPH|nr:hypothetical protein BN77_p2170004 [Rhizobium mesoamericanum STM3625]